MKTTSSLFYCFTILSIIVMLVSGILLKSTKSSTLRSSKTLLSTNLMFAQKSDRFSQMASGKAPRVIFVLGGPGSGKGTQCEKLSKEFGITHLSAGELLRQEQMKHSPTGSLIDTYLKDGRIVPVEITLGLLKQAMIEDPNQDKLFLIDGFPRNHDNLNGWLNLMTNYCTIDLIAVIECSEEEMEKRILLRGKSSNRTDDNLETLRKRFATHIRDSLPVIEYFEKFPEQFNLVKINGNQDIDKVYHDIKTAYLNVHRTPSSPV